ncbi:MAG TPA: cysteine desulfurase [Longimicrobium sp.]|jgi:cysteine desulfurase/selenocysteine lyase|uniref:cysteine desulfurase n=1 Tax=Longimicrobium sp. TaxID=2029185 RepID=UPI002ED7EBB9
MSITELAAPASPLDVARIREDFPILSETVNGKPLVYLDNAASTQKPVQVIDAISGHYRSANANVHRGIHELSNRATDAYDGARTRVARFLGIADPHELIWTRGTTEALNLLAHAWGTTHLKAGDEILLSVLEHHSNLVPWQMVAQRTGARLRFIDIDEQGRLDLSTLDVVLTERTKLVSITHVSNALGTVNPVAQIAARARAAGAVMIVDGAQSAPHLPVDVPSLGCDFYAFSGHKMCGPTGIGGLWGRREALESLSPFHGGGDMIEFVELESSTYAPLPHRLEAGTPNIAGAVGLAAAADYLSAVGRDAILAHERSLLAYAIERMQDIPDMTILGPRDLSERSGVVSFTLADIHPHDLATILDSEGVAIRAGHHCTQPLMKRLGVGSTARASFYLYNTPGEVDALVNALHKARGLFGY